MRRSRAIETVRKARDIGRKTAGYYLGSIFSDFLELHGDRRFGDDKAIVTGIARLKGMPVTVISQERGDSTESRIAVNFGSAHPEGYRKALRHMELAGKFRRPVVCIIDTSGAYCSVEAELRGQGEAIAACLNYSAALDVPVVSIVIGEGGSGGALALGAGDELWMLKDSFYSVISPEGCASILWNDVTRTEEAAENLRILPENLMDLGICDRIIDTDDIHESELPRYMRDALYEKIMELKELSPETLLQRRYERFRKIGVFQE